MYRLEAVETPFLNKAYQVVHSNEFQYFADLPVSSSLYWLYTSRAGLHNQYDTVQASCNTLA